MIYLGETALFKVSSSDVFRILLEAGANIEAQNNKG